MKKAAAGLTMLVLVLSCNMLAFATGTDNTITAGNGSATGDVKAKYVDNSAVPTVYSVDIAWDVMEFTYTVSGTRDWLPENQVYEDNTSTSWSDDGNNIAITNHSNTQVAVAFNFMADSGYSGVTGEFTVSRMTLESAEGKEPSAAPGDKTKLRISGILPSTVDTMTKVGTVTVTVQ